MTNDEKAVASALKKLSKKQRRSERKLNKTRVEVSSAREKIEDNCTHPAKFLIDYKWEHDNGYGRQTMVTGSHCLLCLKSRSWKDMGL